MRKYIEPSNYDVFYLHTYMPLLKQSKQEVKRILAKLIAKHPTDGKKVREYLIKSTLDSWLKSRQYKNLVYMLHVSAMNMAKPGMDERLFKEALESIHKKVKNAVVRMVNARYYVV